MQIVLLLHLLPELTLAFQPSHPASLLGSKLQGNTRHFYAKHLQTILLSQSLEVFTLFLHYLNIMLLAQLPLPGLMIQLFNWSVAPSALIQRSIYWPLFMSLLPWIHTSSLNSHSSACHHPQDLQSSSGCLPFWQLSFHNPGPSRYCSSNSQLVLKISAINVFLLFAPQICW